MEETQFNEFDKLAELSSGKFHQEKKGILSRIVEKCDTMRWKDMLAGKDSRPKSYDLAVVSFHRITLKYT